MQWLIMLKTTHKHFFCFGFVMLQWICASLLQELNLNARPLSLFWGALLSRLFLSLLHYCPRLTAFTSSAGFIWPLCQLRQIGPAAPTQYAMVQMTRNHHKWCFFVCTARLGFACLMAEGCSLVADRGKKTSPDCQLWSFDFLLLDGLMFPFSPHIFEQVLQRSFSKLRSAKCFPSSLFTCLSLRTLIAGSICSTPFQNPYPEEDYDLN